jgi:hypothetical protein
MLARDEPLPKSTRGELRKEIDRGSRVQVWDCPGWLVNDEEVTPENFGINQTHPEKAWPGPNQQIRFSMHALASKRAIKSGKREHRWQPKVDYIPPCGHIACRQNEQNSGGEFGLGEFGFVLRPISSCSPSLTSGLGNTNSGGIG